MAVGIRGGGNPLDGGRGPAADTDLVPAPDVPRSWLAAAPTDRNAGWPCASSRARRPARTTVREPKAVATGSVPFEALRDTTPYVPPAASSKAPPPTMRPNCRRLRTGTVTAGEFSFMVAPFNKGFT